MENNDTDQSPSTFVVFKTNKRRPNDNIKTFRLKKIKKYIETRCKYSAYMGARYAFLCKIFRDF